MTIFTKKQVPFCEWGQSAQLSIYYYDKKTCFLHFFAFFQIQYLYILHMTFVKIYFKAIHRLWSVPLPGQFLPEFFKI